MMAKKHFLKKGVVMMALCKRILISFFLVLFFSCSVFASSVRVESVNLYKYGSAWAVKGQIRNLENHPIKGYAKIKFLNSRGDIVASHSARVNDLDPIKSGQSASFEYYDIPSEFEDVVNFQVIFEDR